MPPTVIDDKTTFNLLHAINAVSHGVIAMSQSLPGLVETSANLASIKLVNPTKIVVGTSQRSSSNSAMAAIISQVQSTFKLAGATINQNDGYPGWSPNPDSAILKVLVSTYKDLFKKDPIIKAVHVGLECGLFLNKYPNLDIVSFAPTLEKLHSPDERVNIPSVQLWWTHLLEVLKNIPDKQSTKYFFE
jgi:dipeptidase D